MAGFNRKQWVVLVVGVIACACCILYPPWNDEFAQTPLGKVPAKFVGYAPLFSLPEYYPGKDYTVTEYTEAERDQLDKARDWQSMSLEWKARTAAKKYPALDSLWPVYRAAADQYYDSAIADIKPDIYGGKSGGIRDRIETGVRKGEIRVYAYNEILEAKEVFRVVDSVMQDSWDTSWVTGHEVTKHDPLLGFAAINYQLLWTQMAVILLATLGLLVALRGQSGVRQ